MARLGMRRDLRPPQVFDPTQSSALGLLGEMSYAELRERLTIAKSRAVEEEEQRRLSILADKRAREEDLKSRVENIVRVRGKAVCGRFTCEQRGCVVLYG
jgi:hypothetical protein